ncbi:MAG: alpha/beta hydrolase [Solirubrobacterales bacterium]
MPPGPAPERQRSRRARWALIVASSALALIAVVAVVSWLLASALLDPHHDLVKDNVETLAVEPGYVVLARTKASARAGVYGLDWPAGHAIVGEVSAKSTSSVTRRLLALRGPLAPHVKVGVDPDVWEGDPMSALGIPFRAVSYPDPLGPMPSWFMPGRGATWVLFVHGLDGKRAGGLRPLRALHAASLPTLLISYRNDSGSPRSPDGHIHLGMTEWQDLDAAARWAVAQGARRFVLYGDSMGGSIVTRFLHLSPLASRVAAMVLDAPVLDWASVIDNTVSREHVPFLGPPLRWMIGARITVDWSALDEISQARDFRLPILLFQGEEDPLVPPSDSRAFARAAPGPVTYVAVAGAGHIESWNASPAAYERDLRTFLTRLQQRVATEP